MWLRNINGSEFHFASAESGDSKFFLAACGQKITKVCLGRQSTAVGSYHRCGICQRLENEKFITSVGKH